MISIEDDNELRQRTADVLTDWYEARGGSLEAIDGDAHADLIQAARIVQEEAGFTLQRWVGAGRRTGMSWDDVGKQLGTTRQAAQKRFGAALTPDASDGPDADEIVVRRVTAFNEVAVLHEHGARGFQVTRAGWGKLYFRPADGPVENRRRVSARLETTIDEQIADGWTFVFSWYPYSYFTRPATPRPAST